MFVVLVSMWKLVFLLHLACGFVHVPHKGYRNTPVIMDKDRYCDERPLHFLSVHDLVFYYGDRARWWGDMGAHDTRSLYHKLLPTYHPFYIMEYDLETLAFKTFETRKAIKTYVRRRSYLHVRMMSILFDLVRNLFNRKKWKGATFEELWEKYQRQVCAQHPCLSLRDIHERTALTLIHKSCCTNQWFDTHFLTAADN